MQAPERSILTHFSANSAPRCSSAIIDHQLPGFHTSHCRLVPPLWTGGAFHFTVKACLVRCAAFGSYQSAPLRERWFCPCFHQPCKRRFARKSQILFSFWQMISVMAKSAV